MDTVITQHIFRNTGFAWRGRFSVVQPAFGFVQPDDRPDVVLHPCRQRDVLEDLHGIDRNRWLQEAQLDPGAHAWRLAVWAHAQRDDHAEISRLAVHAGRWQAAFACLRERRECRGDYEAR